MVVATKAAIQMRTTRVFEDVLAAWLSGKRRILLEGGTSSTKTWSALQALILVAQNAKSPLLVSVVSESLPHLKRGCIRDFFKILRESQEDNPRWSKTEFIYTWGLGRIEFFGADNADKVRGPRRDILYINEGNNIPWETARGLDIRTAKFTVVDWNPVGEFWAHEFWLNSPENAYNHSTYQDALDVVPKEVIANIESNKDKDPNWWHIYGLGLIGKVEGLVHPYFQQVDVLPQGDYFYGLDFGFGAYDPLVLVGGDPTVLVKNVIVGDNLYSQQMFYKRTPMTNDDIAREMELLKISHTAPIYPDPSEPKSAEELRRKGFNIQETEKGAGSVMYGIKRVNSYYQSWTKDSLDCIKDQRNFKYVKKRENSTGREYLSDDTTHQWSHGMDPRRYGVASFKPTSFVMPKPIRY